MSDKITVGEAIARTLEQYAVSAMYGIISIHNLPIADAVGQRDEIRFVPARGEAGAVTMADAHGRFSGLGVALTSTGAGAGNAVGAMIEALNANTPLLHITGQVEKAYLDADAGFIHETRDQLGFLRACSKRAYRVNSPEQAVAVIQRAILDAQTVPCGRWRSRSRSIFKAAWCPARCWPNRWRWRRCRRRTPQRWSGCISG